MQQRESADIRAFSLLKFPALHVTLS